MSFLLYRLYLELESIAGNNLVFITYEYALIAPGTARLRVAANLYVLILSKPEAAFSLAKTVGRGSLQGMRCPWSYFIFSSLHEAPPFLFYSQHLAVISSLMTSLSQNPFTVELSTRLPWGSQSQTWRQQSARQMTLCNRWDRIAKCNKIQPLTWISLLPTWCPRCIWSAG